MVDSLEEWRPVVGFEGVYSVSNQGRIRRDGANKGAHIGRILATSPDSKGYRMVQLYVACAHFRRRVHVLVGRAFLGPLPLGHEINHIDGDKMNARRDNLEQVTHAANQAHAARTGLARGAPGEANAAAKLSVADVRAIKRALVRGDTCDTLARRFGVTAPTIGYILRGKTWPHVWPRGMDLAALRQAAERGRHRRIKCRITARLVSKIRAERAQGASRGELAKRYSIAPLTVTKIVRKQARYAHI